jgi:hypothetical protein
MAIHDQKDICVLTLKASPPWLRINTEKPSTEAETPGTIKDLEVKEMRTVEDFGVS